ncbi:MAG: hypothetical protein HYX93_04305 [Chloroflexi bacterium]|nr:hypothetical protein [Chloroflexota bacterium]
MRRRWLLFGVFLGFILGGFLTFVSLAVYTSITLPSQQQLEVPLRGYLAAAAQGDAQGAYDHVYQGPGQLISLRDVQNSLSPDVYYGYSDLEIDYSFSADQHAYLRGVMKYRDGSQRAVNGVVRKDEFGWGLYQMFFESG